MGATSPSSIEHEVVTVPCFPRTRTHAMERSDVEGKDEANVRLKCVPRGLGTIRSQSCRRLRGVLTCACSGRVAWARGVLATKPVVIQGLRCERGLFVPGIL